MVISGEAEAEPEIACAVDARKRGMLVVLSANTMGTGEEKLGKALMKAFVFALTKQDALPETILCYNTGVCGSSVSNRAERLRPRPDVCAT